MPSGGELQMVIKVLNGERGGQEISSPVDITIGSSYKADVCFSGDKLMMDLHARITLEKGKCWLEDLGSTTGTFVSGKKIDRRVRLQEGSRFQLGNTSFEFKKVKKVRLEKGYMIGPRHKITLRSIDSKRKKVPRYGNSGY
jgi:two-component system response regulator AtoC